MIGWGTAAFLVVVLPTAGAALILLIGGLVRWGLSRRSGPAGR